MTIRNERSFGHNLYGHTFTKLLYLICWEHANDDDNEEKDDDNDYDYDYNDHDHDCKENDDDDDDAGKYVQWW